MPPQTELPLPPVTPARAADDEHHPYERGERTKHRPERHTVMRLPPINPRPAQRKPMSTRTAPSASATDRPMIAG